MNRHTAVIKEIKRIEQELFNLKKQLDPYADLGDAFLFDIIEEARAALDKIV